jgi:N-formylglutamate deformylase
MKPVFDFVPGEGPLLISVPHDGREIPAAICTRMTASGQSIPDTDWYVAKLYEFAAAMGANMLIANYSRYVIDLNRAADDAPLYPGQVATGLCPLQTFAGDALYQSGGVDAADKAERVRDYWLPYHTQLQRTLDELRARHGYALLWDAHSIPSNVPRLFDGELPELNLGSDSRRSCASDIEGAVAKIALDSDYTAVVNGRFKGGFITRHYGDPERGVHALQLEIAQRAYMDEATASFDVERATALRATLREMLDSFRSRALI